jgi:hypothetical protein
MSPLQDQEVDRPEVQVCISKDTQLTGTNRAIGLITRIIREFAVAKDRWRSAVAAQEILWDIPVATRIDRGSFASEYMTVLPGGFGGGGTPVLIPNTDVKSSSGDNTLHGEDSTLPGFFL